MTSIRQHIILLLYLAISMAGIAQNSYHIVPYPNNLEARDGSFVFNKNTQVYYSDGLDNSYRESFMVLNNKLKAVAGISLSEVKAARENNIIICRYNAILPKEGYKLDISSEKIIIEVSSPTGLFYASQSIRQLLPSVIEKDHFVSNATWAISNCIIQDAPHFVYRGMHLDVSRHFATLDEVKKHIDQLALLKMNVFHWHLTDDQGWRIEIKKYPRLTEVGSTRNRTLIGHHNDRPEIWKQEVESGYYTQEEVKELVAYAAQRHITVIPEIEMPGHATAALASYPELSCSGGPIEVLGKWGVFNDVFCTRDETFDFLEDVLDEVIALFPSQYIHIGGDECPKVRWERCHTCQQKIKDESLKDEHELQSYFIKRINRYVQSKGRKIIGWDEILEGGIASDATVMSWRGLDGGIAAAKQGHDVIMTPAYFMYLDFYQSRFTNEPLANGGHTTLETVYNFKAVPDVLEESESKHILGLQANVWTEYMDSEKHREYMIYPRVAAVAEVAWLNDKQKNYKRFTTNLKSNLFERYDYMNLNYARSFYDLSHRLHPDSKEGLRLELFAANIENVEVRYTTDGTEPTLQSPLLKEWIPISTEEKTVKAIAVKNGQILSKTFNQNFIVNKAAGQEVTFVYPNGVRAEQNGGENMTDCIMGQFPLGRFDWYSYAGDDPTIELEFRETTAIMSIGLSAAYQEQVYVYPPQEIIYEISSDGKNFVQIGSLTMNEAKRDGDKVLNELNFEKQRVKKVRLKLRLLDKVQEHKEGAGRPNPGLFFDELIIN